MRRVFYLISHRPHLPYLVCSLHTLRRHWSGPVHVHAWNESISIVEQIARDERLGIVAHHRRPAYRGKNDQFLDKIDLARSMASDGGTWLYLDADTTVHGDLSPVLEAAEKTGFAATQWNDWTTQTKTVQRRIRSLLNYDVDRNLVRQTLEHCWPSVNGGVWAAKPESPVLADWHETTMRAVDTFIADEKVLHLMCVRYNCAGKLSVVGCDGVFNSSPRFRSRRLSEDSVCVWHYHGDSCCRPLKSPEGVDLWWPIYRFCLDQNMGGMQHWRQSVNNRWLDRLEQQRMLCG